MGLAKKGGERRALGYAHFFRLSRLSIALFSVSGECVNGGSQTRESFLSKSK